MNLKWHGRYLDLAEHISTWSKDPSSKVGAVVIGKHGQILSTGYNGFPRGMNDSEELYNNREEKYKRIVHAEMNVIYNASLSGVSLEDSTLYVSGLPVCSKCALGVIQSGISCVVIRESDINKSETWKKEWADSEAFFNEAGVKIIKI